MSFDEKVFRILIASPSDVGEERNVIPEIINEWNAVYASQISYILMPVKWESHSAPLLGDRPQAIINEQIVNECDLLVGVFWTRIGTNTGVAISGSAEEIEQFVKNNKPVMLYFSQSPVNPDKIDIDQFATLRNFQEKMRIQGLTESYSGIPDFRQKFSRQLSMNLNRMLSNLSNQAKHSNNSSIIKGLQSSQKISLTNSEINDFVKKAIISVAGNDGWASVAAIGVYLKTYTPVDYKKLGFGKLNKFLESTKICEVKTEQKSPHAKAVDSAYARLIIN